MKQCVVNWHCTMNLLGQRLRGGRRGQAGAEQEREVSPTMGDLQCSRFVNMEGCTSVLDVEDKERQ